MNRRICVVTSTRADLGLLSQLCSKLQGSEGVDFQLVATGTHLVPGYGNTLLEIKELRLPITAKIPFPSPSSTNDWMALTSGQITKDFSACFTKLRPDIVVLLGDRFEILAVAIAAFLMKIPIAHIHGGEITEGALDDSMRHAITKLSQLHFAAAEPYRTRIIQLGESPENVFFVGAPGLDNIRNLKLLDQDELESSLGIKFQKPTFTVTYHPETLANANVDSETVASMLTALRDFESASIVFTMPNTDSGGIQVSEKIKSALPHSPNWHFFESLGHKRYLSLISISDCVIGNSSSGIIEAPFLGVPTVNIGNRQKGRLRANSIIDSSGEYEQIKKAIELALTAQFKVIAQKRKTPYGHGNAADKMVKILKEVDLKKLGQKIFFVNNQDHSKSN